MQTYNKTSTKNSFVLPSFKTKELYSNINKIISTVPYYNDHVEQTVKRLVPLWKHWQTVPLEYTGHKQHEPNLKTNK